MKNPFRKWYCEDGEEIVASGVEISLFYINLISLAILSCRVLFVDTFRREYFVLLIPTLIWIFLRSSRKDMTATAHWVAGLFGAIGGAASILLLRRFWCN